MPLPPVDELSASASDAESQAERDLGAHDLMGRRRRVRRRILKKKRVPCWRQKGDALTKTLSILVQKKCGSARCKRLYDAAKAKANGPPVDLRYLQVPHARVTGDSASSKIVSYLHSLYESVAETLPDARDDPAIFSADLVSPGEIDEYAVDLVQDERAAVDRKRKRFKSLTVNTERLKQFELRYLPPGCMRDHYEGMKAVADMESVSFSTFWRTWHEQLLVALTSHCIVASATLASLRTGHSHEDVDQCFGSLGKFVVRHARTVETPQQFADVVQKFCHGAARPYEKERLVFILDQHRDWKGSLVEAVPVALRGIGGPGAPHWFEFHRRETLGFLRKH
ncbi:unnamed protein product [Durusdinium trenchii]|uniref:Uncharacterized protein n=1 Tax=Durusdinium trenchii TaxID=1381693 RepID=A0ABP0QMP0_9DINO